MFILVHLTQKRLSLLYNVIDHYQHRQFQLSQLTRAPTIARGDQCNVVVVTQNNEGIQTWPSSLKTIFHVSQGLSLLSIPCPKVQIGYDPMGYHWSCSCVAKAAGNIFSGGHHVFQVPGVCLTQLDGNLTWLRAHRLRKEQKIGLRTPGPNSYSALNLTKAPLNQSFESGLPLKLPSVVISISRRRHT